MVTISKMTGKPVLQESPMAPIAGPAHPIYGISEANIEHRLDRDNWSKKAVAYEVGEASYYVYISRGEQRTDGCQRRSKISPPGRSKTSPLNVMRYAVLGGCPGSP